MVLLNRPTRPFVCRWYAVVARCVTSKNALVVARNIFTNCVSSSVKRHKTHWSTVGSEPMTHQEICSMRGCRFRRR